MRRIFLVLLSMFGFTLAAGCLQLAGYEGDYKGRVVDAETGQPIPGVVVLGVWYSKTPTPAGSTSHFHDAKETVTDGKGEFTIPGKGLKILSNVEPMNVLIFKAGYEHIGMGPWESLKYSRILRDRIKWEGDRAIIPIKKLTIEERRKKGVPSRPSMPGEKMPLLTKEVNKERLEQGLPPL